MKRSSAEVKKDIKRIFMAAKVCHTFKEISELTGLTENQISYSLEKGKQKKGAKELLKRNRQRKSEKHAKKNVTESSSSVDKDVNDTNEQKKSKTYSKKIVLDTSISSNRNIISKLENEIECNHVFIITTLTNHELKNLSLKLDFPGKNARDIINLAVIHDKNFEAVFLEKYPWETVDDSLIKFAKKRNYILWTADKEMYLNAKANKVECVYIKSNYKVQEKHFHGRNTLFNTRVEHGKLIFNIDNCSKNMYTELVKDAYIYNNGEHRLAYGNEIYVAKRSRGCILIEHYKVISTSATANVRLMYFFRIKRPKDVEKIKKDYLVFAKDAIRMFDNLNKKY